jgi:predicted Zn-dependent protease
VKFRNLLLVAVGIFVPAPAVLAKSPLASSFLLSQSSFLESSPEFLAQKTCDRLGDKIVPIAVNTLLESTWQVGSSRIPPFKFETSNTAKIGSFTTQRSYSVIPTATEIARNEILAEGDRLYLCGDVSQAEQLYRKAKKPFPAEKIVEQETIPQPIYTAKDLAPGGAVYWGMYREGLQNRALESKIFTSLQLLTEQHPEFIPGHVNYARELAEAGKEEEARKILQNATSLYPSEPELVRSQIEAYQREEDWLEASLTARQFALLNAEKSSQAREFKRIADENLERYQNELEEDMTWEAIGNAIVGGVGYAITGNIFGPLSAVETSILLLEGEASIGDRYSSELQEDLPLLKDEQVLAYVRAIGNKLIAVAGRDEFNYEFHIVMDDRLNAFALPGGKIFVNAGAILNTNSEAELAGLLAHELSHTVLSHSFQLLAQGSLTSNVTQYIPYVGSAAGNLLVFSYSREMEEQADLYGTKLLAASGYAADGVRNLMVTLDEQDNYSPPAWLSTHPDTSDRVDYIEEAIVQQKLNRYRYEGIRQHQRIQKRVAKLWSNYQKTSS